MAPLEKVVTSLQKVFIEIGVIIGTKKVVAPLEEVLGPLEKVVETCFWSHNVGNLI